MDSSLHPREPGATQALPETAVLFPFAGDSAQVARVSATQPSLFPSTPRSFCDQLGLNWWAALKLHEDGWLSFAPEDTPRLDETQEAELRFVGTLVMAGCDRTMLGLLLRGLPKPYAYDLKRLYYDWSARRWRPLTDAQAHPEAAFNEWLDFLVQVKDKNSLGGILELTQQAISRLCDRPG